MVDGIDIVQSVWDTAGQECFRTINEQYYRKASGIILVYDMTNARTFAKVQYWMEQVALYAEKGVKVMLLGNKADCNGRAIAEGQGEAFACKHNMLFFETSAMTGFRVRDAFVAITRAILRQRAELGQHGI
jgi:Ras-related protein Rab-37